MTDFSTLTTDPTIRRFCPTCNAKLIDGACKCRLPAPYVYEQPDTVALAGCYEATRTTFELVAVGSTPTHRKQLALVISSGSARLQTYGTRAELLALADMIYSGARQLP